MRILLVGMPVWSCVAVTLAGTTPSETGIDESIRRHMEVEAGKMLEQAREFLKSDKR